MNLFEARDLGRSETPQNVLGDTDAELNVGSKMGAGDSVPIVGYLEQVRTGLVRGWAKNQSDDEPLSAELYIDGVAIDVCRCDLYREDLAKAGIGRGFCGFVFTPQNTSITSEGHVGVVVRNASGQRAVAYLRTVDMSPVMFSEFGEHDGTQPQPPDAKGITASVPTTGVSGDLGHVQSQDQPIPETGAQANAASPFMSEAGDSVEPNALHHLPAPSGDHQCVAVDDELATKSGDDPNRRYLIGPSEERSSEIIHATSQSARGCVDVVDENHVLGWAFRDQNPNERVSVEVLIDGEIVGETVSDVYRVDLDAAGIGDGSHAFRFDFPRGSFTGRSQQISVRDKNTGSPLPLGEGLNATIQKDTRIAGAVDNFADNTLSGWVINYRDMEKPVELAIYVGSRLVGRGRTERYRKDIAAKQAGHGFYGFRISLNQKIFREDFIDLRVVAIVYGSPLRVLASIREKLPAADIPTTKDKVPSVKGFLDRADRQSIAGWAIDEVNPNLPTTVDVYVNGLLIRSAVAGLTRRDLIAAYPGSEGRLGFNYQIPYGHTLRGPATVSARLADSNKPLIHSPKEGNLGHPGIYLESTSVRRHRDMIRKARAFNTTPSTGYEPRIAAIVLNRDGEKFLEDLFESVDRHNTYTNMEFVIVDHGSTDDSRAVCNRWKEKLSIRFVDRRRNYSYSSSNNFGAACSESEILFFVNNDIRFSSDFLSRAVAQLNEEVGIVGFKLASPPEQVRTESGLSRVDLLDVGFAIDQIQHLGVRMTTSAGDRPFLPFEEPLTRDNEAASSQPMEVPCVTAAALLVRREDFLRVGGFHEEYFYGFEDVDFCLTFRKIIKKKIISLNDVKLYHFRSASLQKVGETERNAKAKNKDIISRRLGGYILNELRQERIENTSFLRDSTIRVAFLVTDASEFTSAGDYFTALELARELSRCHSFECVFLSAPEWYDLSNFDIAVAMVDGFKPSAITASRSDLILVAWIRNWFDRWLAFSETKDFDAIWVSSNKASLAFGSRFSQHVELVRIGTNAKYFASGSTVSAYACDYCFTGSYFGSWREIIGLLSPESLPYKFALFGHGWSEVDWLAQYYRGPLPYSKMRDVYASTRIVIDDANHTTHAWGSVNSRVFDALAAGALVLTNSRAASDDAFDGLLPVFNSRDELLALLERYLGDEDARRALVGQLREVVRRDHTYEHRARTVADDIGRLLKARRFAISFTDSDSANGVADIVKQAIWAAGNIAHINSNKSALSRARQFGVDVDIRITGLLGAAMPADILECRFNVLIALFQPERISQFEARQLSAKFHFIVTATSQMADIFRAAGASQVYSMNGQISGDVLATLERKLQIEGLFKRGGASMLEHIATTHLEWQDNCKNVAASHGPSLVIQAKAKPDVLRVAYVLWDYPALSQTFIINEIRWLVNNKYDVIVYYKTWADRPATLDFEAPTYKIEDYSELAELLALHGRTVIHSPFAFPATTHLTYPAAKISGIPFTIMPAGVDISHYDNMQRNRLAEISNSPLCIGVITIGSYHQSFLVEQGVPERKIIPERQAVFLPDLEYLEPRPASRTSQSPRIVSIGRFVEKKGLRYLIEAAAQMPDFEVVIYGYGPLEDDLRALAARLRANNVVFGGPLDTQQALWRAYAEADVFCLPCVRAVDGDLDGLPTVILEAMGAGVPVVSSRIANVPDVIINGITGFLTEPGDVDELVKCIGIAVSLNESRRKRIVDAARRKLLNCASVEDTMSTLVGVWSGKEIDIVLVTYDTGKYKSGVDTEEIIDRLYRFTRTPFNLIVVDNGSDQLFIDRLRERYGNFPNFQLVTSGKNLWCGPGTNFGIEIGKSEFIIYLCSKEGFVLRSGWEREMVKYMEMHPDVGMAGHLVTMPNWSDGESYLQYPLFGKFRNQEFAVNNLRKPFSHVQGGVYILRRKTYEQVGGFSANVPQTGTDVEYSYFLESKGWKLGDIPNVYSATVLTQPSVTAMVDENAIVVHPLSARTVSYFDKIISALTKACNVCSWQGRQFIADDATGDSICPNCNSNGFARSTMRLLSLTENLQQKPRIWLVSANNSLVPVLQSLASNFVWDRDLSTFATRSKHADFDLILVDHLTWTKKDITRFTAWATKRVKVGTALVLGEGINSNPIVELTQALPGAPVLYDSAVLDLDRSAIQAFNINVHP